MYVVLACINSTHLTSFKYLTALQLSGQIVNLIPLLKTLRGRNNSGCYLNVYTYCKG